MGLLANVSISRVIMLHWFYFTYVRSRQSQWPRGLRRGSAAARLLGLWARIPPGAWISGFGECSVLLGISLCVGPITRPGDSSRVWCVWVWSSILNIEEAKVHWELLRHGIYIYISVCVCVCVRSRSGYSCLYILISIHIVSVSDQCVFCSVVILL